MDTIVNVVVLVLVLLISVVIHENAHGWVALSLGDTTAKNEGRLTLNPVPHLDPVGSFIMPAFLAVASQGQTTFGWAKPVPISPQRLRGTDRVGFAIVALAGPVSNVVLAFIASVAGSMLYGLDSQIGLVLASQGGLGMGARIVGLAFLVNVFLAAFNLIPVPPLDGSRLLRPFLGVGGRRTLDRIEPYGFLIILLLLTVLQGPFFQVVTYISDWIFGILPD